MLLLTYNRIPDLFLTSDIQISNNLNVISMKTVLNKNKYCKNLL